MRSCLHSYTDISLLVNGLHLGPLQHPEGKIVQAPADKSKNTVTAKVTGLKPLQMYRFYVWAYTATGQGSEYFIDDATVAAGCKCPIRCMFM